MKLKYSTEPIVFEQVIHQVYVSESTFDCYDDFVIVLSLRQNQKRLAKADNKTIIAYILDKNMLDETPEDEKEDTAKILIDDDRTGKISRIQGYN
ncbi:TPA: hypothetical protein U0921_000269 [Streptococcus suis]|uniref:hypothetical protein n=1 Tax=Streptococcus suis TaxID=1307 RepID=UPI0004A7DCB1|nr:hypothetical protein [Streptococcus suis]HEM3172512.1 hypothetical protein [Streptococcus suis]HEM4059231.1 hypothetical protein [Streptococcus suis]